MLLFYVYFTFKSLMAPSLVEKGSHFIFHLFVEYFSHLDFSPYGLFIYTVLITF